MSRSISLFLTLVAFPLALALACLGIETLQKNLLGWVLLLVGVGYVVGWPIYLWRNTAQPAAAREEAGDRSFWIILPGMIVVFFAPPIEYLYLPETLPRSDWLEWIGLGLVATGVALRVWARQVLKGLYTGHVQIVNKHHLVQEGPYRFVRHPGYAGFILMGTGVALGFSSLVGLLAIPVLMIPGLAYRMHVEETLLVERLGDPYLRYMTKTKRIVPRIW